MALDAARWVVENYAKFYSGAFEAVKSALAYAVDKVARMSFEDLLKISSLMNLLRGIKNYWFKKADPSPPNTGVLVSAGLALVILSAGLIYFGPVGCKSSSHPGMCEGTFFGVIIISLFLGGGLICMSASGNENGSS